MERWKINRAGLVNFWYYDNEVFEFKDGRLLLRGSNGSGKSVTMQSFIPLLLDGNINPERLDPFGSRARRLHNYLLDESSEESERTGYIYIEFCKKSSNTYITIGMGLKAVKNKQLDSWGFCLIDGRRIGYDFSLCKMLGENVPLTKKELKNRLNGGGEVYDIQKEYMKKVNELLFGYDSVDDYDELIKLLIQLRSPKLSKDFKPTVVYEIMSNSLQTLTDDDLRPMSEAIENMDNMKSHLENLEKSMSAANKIKLQYDKYNEVVLIDKASDYAKAFEQLKKIEVELLTAQKDIVDFEKICVEETIAIENLNSEKIILEKKKKQLEENDAFKVKESLIELEKLESTQTADKVSKDKKLDELKSREREIYSKIKEIDDKINSCKKTIHESLDNMNEYAKQILFDEQEFFASEFQDKISEDYSFVFLKDKIINYECSLKKVLAILSEESMARKEYDSKCKEVDSLKFKRASKEKQKSDAELLFSETKEEYIEKISKYNENNTYIKLNKEELSKIFTMLYEFNENSFYENILKIFNNTLNMHKGQIVVDIKAKEAQVESKQSEIDAKDAEIDDWNNKKDLEPERKENVIKNREILTSMNIPHVPFYKAVDFNNEVTDALKNIIEESFVEMGILDALIIPEKYQQQVLSMDKNKNVCDKYIFADPNILAYEMSQYLTSEKTDGVTYDDIDNVLKSFMVVQEKNKTYITEEGLYKLGVLHGNVSKTYTSKFIGVNARKRYRQEIIEKLREEKDLLKKDKLSLQSELTTLKEKEFAITQEGNSFPKEDDLYVSRKALIDCTNEYLLVSKEIETIEAIVQQKYKELNEIREKLHTACQSVYLKPLNIDTFNEALEFLNNYTKELHQVELTHKMLTGLCTNLETNMELHEEVENTIGDLSSDIYKLERSINELRMQAENCKEQLKNSDYAKIMDEIDNCLNRLDILPDQIIKSEKNKSKYEEKILNVKSNQISAENKLIFLKDDHQQTKASFENEYKLGYVYPEKNIDNVLQKATEILDTYKSVYKNDKNYSDYEQKVKEVYYQQRNFMTDYNLNLEHINDNQYIKRIQITGKLQGKTVDFYELREELDQTIKEHNNLIKENDRVIFEDILANTMSKKIRAKIYASKQWVEKMNNLMESLDTSSGLKFSLKWKSKKAETEDELGTSDLVKFLEKDTRILPQNEVDKFTKHFRSKVTKARKEMEDKGETKTFHSVMKDILDYRQWFEFQLYFTKTNEKTKELTNNAFFIFSGGEKAMAMYVPLFSAVYARYEGGRKDSPRIISLDEAFAGVDSKNIRDMFRLLVELDLSFVINSQILWGDYDTVPNLSICELLRPNNATCVSIIRYLWNGKVMSMEKPE